ncbi:MAG: DUF1549 and DUF1553 domain-containing protein [Planctomycetaceae bacterium]|nr:DUF1549 and DUF1553 domain-containing protein [Planctomycetaceae bacterium]
MRMTAIMAVLAATLYAGTPVIGGEEPGSEHWAFQPVIQPEIPRTRYQVLVRSPVDAFIFHRLEKRGLSARPSAGKEILHRRLSLDLLGLPPTLEQQDHFANDTAPGAWERLVDRLLARPEYGERWARHWLDVARYAESNGYERDATKPNAWRFRDYVIAALNSDLPFDRFLTEQLAGDEISESDARTQIATTFLRLGTWDDEPADPTADRYDQLDDVLGTTSTAFLGLTIHCARCHDHKFEPLSQKDYYGLLAAFTPMKRPETIKSATHREEHDRMVGSRKELESYRSSVRLIAMATATAKTKDAALTTRVRRRVLEKAALGNEKTVPAGVARAFLREPSKQTAADKSLIKSHQKAVQQLVSSSLTPQEQAERSARQDHLKQLNATRPPEPPRAYIWYEDSPKAPETRVFKRGDPYSPLEAVGPTLPVVLHNTGQGAPQPTRFTSGRRIWLARWMTNRSNPLVARVFVNRVWQHHFGEGLVTTESDFGEMGDVPVQQDLLDWLAADLVEHGWQIKRLHRRILYSAAYRMDSADDEQSARVDPQERLLWRWRHRRIDAEAFRDSVLAISGKLNRTMRGPSVFPQLPQSVLAGQSRPGSGWGKAASGTAGRRSIYIFSKRSLAVPELALLDAPNSANSCAQRTVSTTGPQALTFLNGRFTNNHAAAFAERLTKQAGSQPRQQTILAFRLALCREATPAELDMSLKFLAEQARLPVVPKAPDADPARRALAALCLVLFNTNEFAYTR